MRGVFVCGPTGFRGSARVQVSPIWPITHPIPEDLSRKPRPDTHSGAQARLVHHNIDPAGQIHLEESGLALLPGVDEYEIVK